ncbi:MAG: bifunctional folylpolyglutamate synthase/dihydrofolate synthase [Bacillota bacterium]
MNYQEALDYIHGIYKFGSKLGLENITYLLELMGNPHKGLKVIHVAGTNGKGSTSSFIHSVLVKQGYKVGLYTSPFLEEFTERIRINHFNISKEDLGEITAFVKEKVEQMLLDGKSHPTEFEVVTAIGFEYFKRQQVDYLVLEVGLGGKGDSTNVIDHPLVSVITPIDFDHIDYLGDTIEKIAFEKAGIIKAGCPVVSHPQRDGAKQVIEEVCSRKEAALVWAPVDNIQMVDASVEGQRFHIAIESQAYENLHISLLGEHQTRNAAVALTALHVLKDQRHVEISQQAIYEGMEMAAWPGRLEIMKRNPTILIDGAHNFHGMRSLAKALKDLFSGKSIHFVIGVLGDKDVKGMLSEIMPLADTVILTKPQNPRAMSLDRLKSIIEDYGKNPILRERISEAVETGISTCGKEDVLVFCGSLYMIGEVRTILKNRV